jgi:excinuclease ABC subunit A
VHYKGKTISEVLEMPIEEAAEFFKPITKIHRHLETLVDVGLGYVRLGQPAPTLSGGEAQRVKLAAELQKRSTGRTVYVLDEPTTGLHFEDVHKLLGVLQSLVDKGNSVFVIEHNLDVIKTADWVIDMGPEGGSGGGLVVAEGTPEEIALIEASHTGSFLKHLLDLSASATSSRSGSARRAAKTAPLPAGQIAAKPVAAAATRSGATPATKTATAATKTAAKSAGKRAIKSVPAKSGAAPAKTAPAKSGAAKSASARAAPAKTASVRRKAAV